MKSPYIFFLVAFLLALSVSFGQPVKAAGPNQGPVVKKGYYSIGNHSEKLQTPQQLSQDTFASPEDTKGYHSIKSNRKSLSKKSGW